MEKTESEMFYEKLDEESVDIKAILWPLCGLTPRERSIFTEYHYWKTHMKLVAESHKISLGRAYEILYRSEEKIAATRAQKETKEDHGGRLRQGARPFLGRI